MSPIQLERHFRFSLCVAVLLALLPFVSGCNALGFAANAVGGGETKPATFTMPKRATVIIAENYSNPSDSSGDNEPLARYVFEALEAHQVAPMIDPEKVFAKQQANPASWKKLTIAAAGRAVGAEQVLYIDVTHIGIDPEGDGNVRGRGEANIRVIDAATGKTMWPTEASAGYAITSETRLVALDPSMTDITQSHLRAELLRGMGQRIARLFYSVKAD